jgi:hypothetical protein
MFHKKTVFILGAGASWHYGYPIGEQLIKQVIAKARAAQELFQIALKSGGTPLNVRPNYLLRDEKIDNVRDQWASAAIDCKVLTEKLMTVDPLVIDYFLGMNPQRSDIGKLLIAWVLLECEMDGRKCINPNRRDADSDSKFQDNWYRFIVHKLVSGCRDGAALLNNNVTFITFNYDVSLEQRLHQSLSAIAQFADADGVILNFFESRRFIHIYGSLREHAWSDPRPIDTRFPVKATGDLQYWQSCKEFFDSIFKASKLVRTIAPYEKIEDRNVTAARAAIAEAQCVYILGYGFDENNSKLIGLDEALYYDRPHGQATPKTVLFTNFADSNQVNKKASRLFFHNRTQFLVGQPAMQSGGASTYEKSVRDVYGALALDFDSSDEA